MARQEIILGTAPTGLGGDPPRTASTKINAMTLELYARNEALGTAASRNVQTTNVDSDSTRVMLVGAFGLGTFTSPELPNATANVAMPSGNYNTLSSWTGSPFTGTDERNLGFLTVRTWANTNYVSQTFRSLSPATGCFERQAVAGVFSAWTPSLTTQTSVGTVNTTKTGAIIERGDNASGSYIRYADGTQVNWGSQYINASTPAGSFAIWDDTRQPKPFLGAAVHHVNIVFFTGTGGGGSTLYSVMQNFGKSSGVGMSSAGMNTGQLPSAVMPSFTIGTNASQSYAAFFQSMGRWY